MGRSRNVAILVVITVMLLKTTEAEDYEVGGNTGWTSFPPGVFNFESGSHSVVELSKADYENCGVDNNIKSFNIGPARVTLTGHCSSGQKLSVTVEASSPSPSASPQTHSTDIAPPPHSSATPLASTFSLFIITIQSDSHDLHKIEENVSERGYWMYIDFIKPVGFPKS
ncbi:hypothetical protein V8G54_017509 [Vigna mungo]|uniref:Phytocyanin domain-containing protein n=1 Tax=Vigna mungo TaxID=3915 RepID=A0AAQ3S287_VIGMU